MTGVDPVPLTPGCNIMQPWPGRGHRCTPMPVGGTQQYNSVSVTLTGLEFLVNHHDKATRCFYFFGSTVLLIEILHSTNEFGLKSIKRGNFTHIILNNFEVGRKCFQFQDTNNLPATCCVSLLCCIHIETRISWLIK